MDLSSGFQIEEPSVLVPWGVREHELLRLLPVKPREVTAGYYVIESTSLGGLKHMLGFHFHPRKDGRLHELEFFRTAYPDIVASFEEFQDHLVTTFGPPTTESPGDEGLPNYSWNVGDAWIRHYVFDRFGPEEHVRMGHS